MKNHYDVAIIGGGPAGSTVAGFLKKYKPELEIVIFEREIMPRDHVGESLLPRVTQLLNDLGAWDKIEAADFAIKVGAKYRWGTTDDFWDFDFIPGAKFDDQPRPGKFEGQRALTAFQVDRSIYDKILLDHARSVGAEVYEDVKVTKIHFEGDKVTGLSVAPEGDLGREQIGEGGMVTARHYVDGSGSSGLLRRTLGIPVDSPTNLRNIAIWDYWQNAEWAEHIGIGGTRIRVMSLGWGWIWFIPLTATRTSIGLVLPADYLKSSGKKPEELYLEAVFTEPEIARLLKQAERENILHTTKDWNYITERLAGENWFLAGDSGGFADPILSAGLTLAQTGAERVANTILELDRGELDADWLRKDYSDSQRAQIRNHMAFADYWYSAKSSFLDLKENCAVIAKDSGLVLDGESAFQWLGTGGFAHDALGAASSAYTRISSIHHTMDLMKGTKSAWGVEQANVFHLNTDGATKVYVGNHGKGRIHRVRCLKRGSILLPFYLAYGAMYEALSRESELPLILERFVFELSKTPLRTQDITAFWHGIETLEAMIAEGWVKASYDPKLPTLRIVSGPVQFFFGWWKEGVGITGMTRADYGKVILSPSEMDMIVAGSSYEDIVAARTARV